VGGEEQNLMIQGHGVHPSTLGGLLNFVRKEFKEALDTLRTIVRARYKQRDDEIDFGLRNSRLVRRTPAADSEFVDSLQIADWWLKWVPDPLEGAIIKDSVLKQRVEDTNKIEYKKELTGWFGYFPLWLPTGRRNSHGKFSDIKRVEEDKKIMDPLAGFTTGASSKGMLWVIRPTVDI
jgi:hypothetical protein